jgi:hypothetical protein
VDNIYGLKAIHDSTPPNGTLKTLLVLPPANQVGGGGGGVIKKKKKLFFYILADVNKVNLLFFVGLVFFCKI